MTNSIRFLIALFILIIVGCGIWYITLPPNYKDKNAAALTVSTVPVKIQPMPIEWQTIGTVQSQYTATIVPQVTGNIKQIVFQEGQTVKTGDVLMTIDPLPFEINLRKAQADLLQDEAKLKSNQADTKRYATLVKTGYVSQQGYDQALATSTSQAAIVAADRALVEQAKVQLGYTQITAPIDGKTGITNINVGDLVTANTSTLLVVNQLDPLQVVFTIPQNKLEAFRQYQNAGPIKVVVNQISSENKFDGEITVVDNNVDANTGTITLKATIANPKQLLWPGQLVNVTIILTTQTNAIVVPSTTVQIDQQGNFMYVNDNGKARLQRVTVDREWQGLSVISKGLQGNETVLDKIPPNLVDGSALKAVN